MEPTLSIDTIPPEILSAAAKVSEWCEKNAGHYWQLAGLCDRRYAFRAELMEEIKSDAPQTESPQDR
jgi:hypothetical protein